MLVTKNGITVINNRAIAHVHCTATNTIITLTDTDNQPILCMSAGKIGLKGAKRSTAYAGQLVAEKVGLSMKSHGVRVIDVWLKGFGQGRDAVVFGFINAGVQIFSIRDVTSIPFSGCKPSKRRRL